MKKLLHLFALLFLWQVAVAQSTPPIIPLPQSFEPVNEKFELTNHTRLTFDPAFAGEAQFLREQLFDRTRIPISVTPNANEAQIVLIKNPNANPVIGSYSMTMSQNRIEITSSNTEGVFYGVISLLQLVSSTEAYRLRPFGLQTLHRPPLPAPTTGGHWIPCWNIVDEPEYEWRGFMLDESRHFFGVEKVKQLLEWMAFYKLNRFHWHLTDEPGWRLEIKKYPYLAFVGGIGNYVDRYAPPLWYTQEQIREIVRFAAERHIVIIPEIGMPGHAAAAVRAYPQFDGGGSERNPSFTLNPGKEEVYQFLTNILREVDMLFPSGVIHLGGDEVHFGNQQWPYLEGVRELMERENLPDLLAVEHYFMQRMADSLFAMNNIFLAWDEMANLDLPKDKTIIMWWRHDRPQQLTKALESGFSVILCPRRPLYFDFVQDDSHQVGRRWAGFNPLEDVYNFSTRNLVEERHKGQVLGMQANLWTETVGTEKRFDFMIFPRISALAEAAWGNNKDFDNYLERLKNHLPLYRKDNIFFFNPFDPSESPEPQY